MDNNRMTRQKAYALQTANARQHWESIRRAEIKRRAPYRTENGNTLGPQEDVVESRNITRNRVNISAPRAATTKNILTENIILLIFLVGSIYGLYRLSLYLLNQS